MRLKVEINGQAQDVVLRFTHITPQALLAGARRGPHTEATIEAEFSKAQRDVAALAFELGGSPAVAGACGVEADIPGWGKMVGVSRCAGADYAAYSKERGRVLALERALRPVSRDVRRAIWQAYHSRQGGRLAKES